MVDPHFHHDSYGYRPGKSALDAVGMARKRCWTPTGSSTWISEVSLIPFRMTWSNGPWPITPIFRGPSVHRAVAACPDAASGRFAGGADEARRRAVSSVRCWPISFCTMRLTCGCSGRCRVHFEALCGRAIVHCGSEQQGSVLEAIRGRLAQCGLELHPTKTRIVYCKDDDRPRNTNTSHSTFWNTFQPRRAKNRWGNSLSASSQQ